MSDNLPTRWLSLTIMIKRIMPSALALTTDTDTLSSSAPLVSGNVSFFCRHLGLTWITSAVSNVVFLRVKDHIYTSKNYDQFLMLLLLHFVLVDEFIILVGKRKLRTFLHSESSSGDVISKIPKKHMIPDPKNGLHCIVLIHESRT